MLQVTPKYYDGYDPWAVITQESRSTPDFVHLNKCPFDEFPVFIFGNMRKMRRDNTKYLAGCNYYGKAVTWGNDFFLKRNPYEYQSYGTDSAFNEPLMFNFLDKDKKEEFIGDFNFTHSGKVEGEVWGVPLRALCKIDEYQGNGHGTQREEVWVDLLDPIQTVKKNVKCMVHTVDLSHYKEFSVYHDKLISCNSLSQGDSRIFYFSS